MLLPPLLTVWNQDTKTGFQIVNVSEDIITHACAYPAKGLRRASVFDNWVCTTIRSTEICHFSEDWAKDFHALFG